MSIFDVKKHITYVASFAEAWIEIHMRMNHLLTFQVASFAEAWIEI